MNEVAIIGGAGNIGSILSAHIGILYEKEGKALIIVDPLCKNIEHGINICGAAQKKYKPKKLLSDIRQIPEYVNYIIIAAKTSCLDIVVQELKKKHRKEISYLIAQNGLGNEEYLEKELETKNVSRLIINMTGKPHESGTYMRWLSEKNYIGSKNAPDSAKWSADLLTRAGLPTEYHERYKENEWEKVILNSTLMPICSIYNMTMEQAMANKEISNLTKKVMDEGIKVAKADGYDLSGREYQYIQYLKNGGPHKPSMMQDIESKRKTEIDWINGAIARKAEELNIEAPLNKMLLEKIKEIENTF